MLRPRAFCDFASRPRRRSRRPALGSMVPTSGAAEPGLEALPDWRGCLQKPVRARLLARAVERLSAEGAAVEFLTRERLLAGLAPTGSRTAEPPARFDGRRVLVVEDNATNQKVVQRMLERLQCEVVVVANGRDAVERMRDERFDVVLMDCQMPVMDGYEATRRIRQMPEPAGTTPIVALTANAMASDRDACLQSGMDDFLAKPLRPDELTRTIARWLGHTSSRGLRAA